MSFAPEFPKEQPRIYKYSFGCIDRGIMTAKIEGSKLLNVLDIQEQGYDLVLWAEVDTAQKHDNHTIQIYSAWTSDPPPGEGWSYFKTIQSQIDRSVYHIYIKHNY